MVVWLQFIICAGLVVLVGIMLSRYADVLAEKTGLGRSWVGAVLLAGATSLPELATGISAVVVVGDVNLAAGGVIGSCLFNLALIAILDLSSGTTPLLKRAHISQILAAGLGCILLTSVTASLYITQTLTVPALGWIGIPSILILAIYILSVRMLSFYEKRRAQEVLEQSMLGAALQDPDSAVAAAQEHGVSAQVFTMPENCLLYTSDAADE